MRRNSRSVVSDLIESTITTIAREGLDKATTRAIAGECHLPDSYIYIHFKGKDELLAAAFQKEDMELVEEVQNFLDFLNQEDKTNQEKLSCLFRKIWKKFVSHPERCRFFVQYYHSTYYQMNSAQGHTERWLPVILRMKDYFQPGAEVYEILRPVFNMLLDQAMKAVSENVALKEEVMQRNCHFADMIVSTYVLFN